MAARKLKSLTSSTHSALGAALRRRAARSGLCVCVKVVESLAGDWWHDRPTGVEVGVDYGKRSEYGDQVAAWLHSNVAAEVLDDYVTVWVTDWHSCRRVFGTLGDYLTRAFDGPSDYVRLPSAYPEDDWAHWRTTIAPELAAAVEAAAPSLAGYEGSAEDLLGIICALFSLPPELVSEALAPTV